MYIAILTTGKILNIDTWEQAKALRHSIKLLLTIENNKCHSVRVYDSSMDELTHAEDEYLV